MDILFYVLMTMFAIYAIFHYKDVFCWWLNIMWIVPKSIWKSILKLFGRG